jgi:hypothetical protein
MEIVTGRNLRGNFEEMGVDLIPYIFPSLFAMRMVPRSHLLKLL